jgi:hypothetical protein
MPARSKCNGLLAPVSLQDFGLVILQISLEQWPTSAVYRIQFPIQPRPKGEHVIRESFHEIVALFPVFGHLRAGKDPDGARQDVVDILKL